MASEKRQEALFGAFDGVVSIVGVVVGLLLQHSSHESIAVVGLAGGIAAAVSMGCGELAKSTASVWRRLPIAAAMFIASLTGALVPVWPFFIFPIHIAILVGVAGCLAVATWIGHQKRQGWRGYLMTYTVFIAAVAITLGVVALIPRAG